MRDRKSSLSAASVCVFLAAAPCNARADDAAMPQSAVCDVRCARDASCLDGQSPGEFPTRCVRSYADYVYTSHECECLFVCQRTVYLLSDVQRLCFYVYVRGG